MTFTHSKYLVWLLSSVVGFAIIANPKLSIMFIPVALLSIVLILFLKDRLNLFHFAGLFIPLTIFSPNIGFMGLPSISLGDLWLMFGLLVFMLKLAVGNINFFVGDRKVFNFFMAFIVWITITIFISSFKEPYYYSNRDWLEVFKNMKLLALFLIAANIRLDKERLTKLSNILVLSLFISALFGFAQFYNFAGVNSWLTPYFIYETQVHGLVTGRVVSFFGNSNVFAGFLLMGIGITLSKTIFQARLQNIIPLTTFLVALFLTQSRTGLVCAVAMAAVIFLLSAAKTKKRFRFVVMGGITAIVPFIALKFAPERFFYRVSFLNDISTDNSYNVRLQVWKQVYEERVRGRMITGTGPVSKLHYYYDNEWLQLLTNYGIIGVGIFLILFLIIFFKIGRMGKVNSELQGYSIAWQGIMVSYALYMVTLAVFQQLQMMPVIILFLGLLSSLLLGKGRTHGNNAEYSRDPAQGRGGNPADQSDTGSDGTLQGVPAEQDDANG